MSMANSVQDVFQAQECMLVDVQDLSLHVKRGFIHVDCERFGEVARTRSGSCPPTFRGGLYAQCIESCTNTETPSQNCTSHVALCNSKKCMNQPYYHRGMPERFDSDLSTMMGNSSTASELSGDESPCRSVRCEANYPSLYTAEEAQNILVPQESLPCRGYGRSREGVFGMEEQHNQWGPELLAANKFEEHDDCLPALDANVTALMLKNIPCRCTKSEVLDAIESMGFDTTRQLNFFYLPIKRGHHQNNGYAFLGFQDPCVAAYFSEVMTGFQFPGRRSTKICEVSPARIQGIQKICNHFSATRVMLSKRAPIIVNAVNRAAPSISNKAAHRRW